MKRKLLTFLFAIFLIIPCAFIVTACDSGNPPTPPQNPPGNSYTINFQGIEGTWITEEDADSPFSSNIFEYESNKTYALWLSDIYNKNSLQVYLDSTALSLDFLPDPDYEERVITESPRKIATITIPSVSDGIHDITCSVEEEELTVKFVGSIDDYTSAQRSILNNWCLPLAEGKSFSELIGTDFTITTTYTELRSTGIPYTCNKRFGYYLQYAIFQTVESEYLATVRYMGGEEKNEYIFNVDPFLGFVSKDIELVFNTEALNKNSLSVDGLNANSYIMHYVDGDEGFHSNYAWPTENENDIKIYLEPYAGVNLDAVEVYIYETKMNLQNDNGQKFFTIPKNALPIDYYNGTVENLLLHNTFGDKFIVTIKNVVVDESSNLFTKFIVNNTNPNVTVSETVTEYYTNEEGVTYYMPNNLAVLSFGFETSIQNASIVINGQTILLDSYIVPNPDLTETENDDAYRTGDNYSYFNVEPIINSLYVTFDEDDNITSMIIDFYASDDTTIEIIFE